MKSLNVPSKVWMHCDSSSMRAPTFFGLYLSAVYPEQAKRICDQVDLGDFEWHSRPDEYAKVSMERDPGVKALIDGWASTGVGAAYQSLFEERKASVN